MTFGAADGAVAKPAAPKQPRRNTNEQSDLGNDLGIPETFV